MKNKIIFIPGWMQTLGTYEKYEGLEIWKGKMDYKEKIDTEYVIGHSLGANFVVLNQCENKNTKIILINPLLPRRNIFNWIWRYIKTRRKEGFYSGRKVVNDFKNNIAGFFKFMALVRSDLLKMMDEIPKDKIIILRGRNDHFLCDEKTADIIKSKGINMIEIDEVGHKWDKKFNEEIEKIVGI